MRCIRGDAATGDAVGGGKKLRIAFHVLLRKNERKSAYRVGKLPSLLDLYNCLHQRLIPDLLVGHADFLFFIKIVAQHIPLF